MSASDPTRRKPGRPRADEPGVRLSTWLPAHTFDALAKYARRHDESFSSVVRRALTRVVAPHKPPESR